MKIKRGVGDLPAKGYPAAKHAAVQLSREKEPVTAIPVGSERTPFTLSLRLIENFGMKQLMGSHVPITAQRSPISDLRWDGWRWWRRLSASEDIQSVPGSTALRGLARASHRAI